MALPGRLRERMGALAERNARASALVHDRTYRASVAAALGLAVNATYAAGNLALGVAGASAWLVTWGCYYAALAATRLLAVRGGLSPAASTAERGARPMRDVGRALIGLTVVLSGMVLLTANGAVEAGGDGIAVISQATYTFGAFTAAAAGFVRRRSGQGPIERTLRAITMVSALVSMFSLQATLLETFGGAAELIDILTGVTGTVVCAACAAVGASLVRAERRAVE